jgi:hypothetical protein
LCPIISDKVVGYAKLVRDLLDEFHRLGSYNGSCGLYLDPFYEFIHFNKDVCESTFGFLEWTYQIQPPCRKRLGDRYGLELMGRYVFLVSKELATFTTTDQGVGIRVGSGPIKALPIRFAHMRVCTYVTVADS